MQEGVIRNASMMEEQGSERVAVIDAPCTKKKSSFHCSLEPIYRFCARMLTHLAYNIDAEGFDKIPDRGPAILICNHIAYIDGLIINAVIKNRRVRYIIEKSIYDLPVINYFMKLNRGIPIAPNKEDVAAALDMIAEGLENGDIICIFPEGQMTYTGNIGRFKPGVEWMINRTPVPVYPMALKGVWGSIFSRKYRKSKFRFIPRSFRRKISIKCGDPIPPEKVKINYLQKRVLELLQE